MKIDKLIRIKDVGRFEDYKAVGASGDLSKICLIYGQNGSGKSTLATIFSSLEAGAFSGSISKRKRVGTTPSAPEIDIRVGGDIVKYRNSTGWSKKNLSISVFGSAFINENIYSGEAVFKEQRENLFLLLF